MENRPIQLNGGSLGPTPELDGIRGWACASVLLAHCLTGVIKAPPGSFWESFNSHTLWVFLGGVDLFFVLSGFLIGGILIDAKTLAGSSLNWRDYAANFWIRRIARIFPVAYLLIATYCVALFVRNRFGIAQFDNWLLADPRPPVLSFVTFTQSWWIAAGGYGGPRWLGITWSLAIEEQFYLLFPFAVYFLPRKWLVAVVIACLVAAPVLRDVLERLFGSWYAPYVLLPSRVDGLMFGVAVALIIRNQSTFHLVRLFRRPLDFVALVILYLIMSNYAPLWWPGPSGAIYPLKQSLLALMWAIVILRVFTYERSIFNAVWRTTVLVKIGLISYGLYMYHQAVNGLVHGLLFDQEPTIANVSDVVAGLGVLVIAFGIATLSYIYFESPIRRLGQRLTAASRHNPNQDFAPAIGDTLSHTLVRERS
jgi:peptidoglycan/LPS O-acetylase OafA/YrhL